MGASCRLQFDQELGAITRSCDSRPVPIPAPAPGVLTSHPQRIMSAFQTQQPASTVVQSRSRSRESAGINRSGVANERVVRERPSQPLGPEPYAEDGNVLGVAWARGTCRPAIELRNLHRPACRPCPAMGKATRKAAQNGESPEDAAESENLSMHGNSRRENREIPSASPKWGTVGEGHWPYVRHVRGWRSQMVP